MDYSLPGSSVHGIFQARILECALPFPSPGDLPDPGTESASSAFLADSLLLTAWEALDMPSQGKRNLTDSSQM